MGQNRRNRSVEIKKWEIIERMKYKSRNNITKGLKGGTQMTRKRRAGKGDTGTRAPRKKKVTNSNGWNMIEKKNRFKNKEGTE